MADVALPGLVLAAGASQRMGRPKALLALDGVTFVARVVAALVDGGATSVLVITREALCVDVASHVGQRARVVVNPRPERGMQSSIEVGLEALVEDGLGVALDGVMIALVDQPALRADTVAALVDAFRRDPSRIVVPRSSQGRRGHPVIFPALLFTALREALAEGAREVLWTHADRVCEVWVDDDGAFRNVNTPHDLAALEEAFRLRL